MGLFLTTKMSSSSLLFLVLCLAISFTVATSPQAQSCKFTDSSGYTYDFSSLTTTNLTGYNFHNSLNGTDYLWQINVCANVQKPFSSNCSRVGPGYSINTTNGDCLVLGDVNTYAFDTTPENDGVMLTYYHGDYVNHITSITSRLYLVCSQTAGN